MSDLTDALAAASRDWIGDTPTAAMTGAMRAFVSRATTDEALVRNAAASLHAREPGSAAFIAIAFGSLVERGASPDITGPAVLDELRAWLPELPSVAPPTPDQAMRLARFQFLCQSAVTHLARLPEWRHAWGQDPALLERLDELSGYSPGARWVHEALTKESGTLVVLYAPSGTGLRLSFTNVSTNFHLFSLLQTAVGTSLPGGRTPDARIDRVARGKSHEPVVDAAWWHYGSPRSPRPAPGASVAGEALVRDFPRVDGEPVVLLWPPIGEGPSWDAGSFGPHLEAMPADAAVERRLTPEESHAWLGKLGVARQRKRWWPF